MDIVQTGEWRFVKSSVSVHKSSTPDMNYAQRAGTYATTVLGGDLGRAVEAKLLVQRRQGDRVHNLRVHTCVSAAANVSPTTPMNTHIGGSGNETPPTRTPQSTKPPPQTLTITHIVGLAAGVNARVDGRGGLALLGALGDLALNEAEQHEARIPFCQAGRIPFSEPRFSAHPRTQALPHDQATHSRIPHSLGEDGGRRQAVARRALLHGVDGVLESAATVAQLLAQELLRYKPWVRESAARGLGRERIVKEGLCQSVLSVQCPTKCSYVHYLQQLRQHTFAIS